MNALIKRMFIVGNCCACLGLAITMPFFAQNDRHLIPECPAIIAVVAPTTTEASNPLTFDAQVPKKGLDDRFSQQHTFKRHGNIASFTDLLSPTVVPTLPVTTTISQIDGLLAKTVQSEVYANTASKEVSKIEAKQNKYGLKSLQINQSMLGIISPMTQPQLVFALQKAIKKASVTKTLIDLTAIKNKQVKSTTTQSMATVDQVLMREKNTSATIAEQAEFSIRTVAHSLILIKKEPLLINNLPQVMYNYAVTAAQIAQTYGLLIQDVVDYNDLIYTAMVIPPNVPIYLGEKKSKGILKWHTVQANEKMWTIAQRHGIRLDKLYERNQLTIGQQPIEGEEIWLREKADVPPKVVVKKREQKPLKENEGNDFKYKYDRKDPGRMFNG